MILLAAGSGQVLHSLGLAYFENAGDEIVAAVPSYGSIERSWEAYGGVVHRVPLKNYTHDLDGMLKKVHAGTKMVSICNPNNPTGTIVPYNELEAFIDAVPKSVLVVVDEAYVEFVADDNYQTSIGLATSRENVISVRTFSKIFGLAGVRVGYAIAHPDINQKLSKYHYNNGISLYGKVAAEAALTDYSHQRNSRQLAIDVKQYFEEEFEAMGLGYIRSESSFMLVNLKRDARPIGRALQQRKMPLPVAGGLYRIDEMIEVLMEASKPAKGQRRPRFNLASAAKWFRAGPAARRVNAQLTMREIDPATIERAPRPERDDPGFLHP